MSKRFGFTLAEVLITLGVIGIVAAMTVPVLISNTNGAKFRNQYKKTVSTLNQAALLSKANFGYDFAATEKTCPEDVAEAANQHPEEHMTFCSILNGTLSGMTYYGKVTNIKRHSKDGEVEYRLESRDTIPDNYTNYLAYALNDGVIIAFHPDAKACELPMGRRPVQAVFSGEVDGANMSHCVGFIDVNGVSLPNREVSCSRGENKVEFGAGCVVENNANRLLDVYPIVFNGASVEPASGAAKFVLDTEKI
ncbi:type II secretion system protein [bacterium]|nr:type II secretion system protein [bacterium]